jgi:hypothetical protein
MRWLMTVAIGLLTASSLMHAQQPGGAGPSATRGLPVPVELPTLNNHLRSLAGMVVHVRRAAVHDLVAPQAFVIEDTRDFGFRFWRGARRYTALVVTDRPIAGLREGVPVTLTGRALTYFDATSMQGRPDFLTDEDLEDRFDRAVVLMADQVTTPAGIGLYTREQ